MARTIAPGNPASVQPVNVNIPDIDLEIFDKLGDAKIKSAMQNFNLYATSTVNLESQKLYQQYKDNPIALANALSKLPSMFKDLPPAVQNDMKQKLDSVAIPMVMKAQTNQQNAINKQNKTLGYSGIDTSKQIMAQVYQNILKNHISKAEDKQPINNDIFLQQAANLNNIADMQDSSGLYMYSESERKKMRNIDDLELAGFKQFFDTMLINDNDNLEKSKDYYTKFLLAPERFMKENYMNRETYDKARAYAEKELKRAGADIQKAKFNQSVMEAMSLQIEDAPGKVAELQAKGFDKALVKNIETVNVKFNDIDPSIPETPLTMLNMLGIINSWEKSPNVSTDEDKLMTLAQGTAVLDSLAQYGQKYGLSPQNVEKARKMVVMKEQNRLYGDMLNHFGEITQSFGTAIPNMQQKLARVRGEKAEGKNITFLSDMEMRKLMELNNELAKAEDISRNALRNGDMTTYYQTQQNLSKKVAQIKYSDGITNTTWAEWEANPEKPIEAYGRMIKVIGFTQNGDIIVEK